MAEDKKEWNDAQKEAINSNSKNLLVSAGAGSGKTAVMIERICRLLKEGKDIRRMLVVTFTNAAATEMKARLSEKLALSGDDNLKASIKHLPTADISTLHSWCNRIIKKWFFDDKCNLDREFAILDDGEVKAALESTAADVIKKYREGDAAKFVGKDFSPEEFDALYTAVRNHRSDGNLIKMMTSVYNYAIAQPDPEGWLKIMPAPNEKYSLKKLLEPNTNEICELKKKAEAMRADIERDYPAGIQAIDALIAAMGGYFRCEEMPPKPENKHRTYTPAQYKAIQAICKALEDCIKAYNKLIAAREKFKKENPELDYIMPGIGAESEGGRIYSLRFSRVLCSLVGELKEEYGNYKRKHSKADYSDLEHCALALLGGGHSEDIVNSYDYVFVDEYQDISPLQEKILGSFKCNMFFVGDVKQSIYGFRMCSPEYFTDKYNTFPKFDKNEKDRSKYSEYEAVDLYENYRSDKKVLECVNDVFGKLMSRERCNIDYVPLVSKSKFDGKVRYIKVEETKGEISKKIYSIEDDKAESLKYKNQIDAVINEINELVQCPIEISKEEASKLGLSKNERMLNYDDIAILFRSIKSPFCKLLIDTMRKNYIPVSLMAADMRAEDFSEVSALISFMRVLDNARDDVNIAAVLGSESFGRFSLDEIGKIKSCGKTLYDSVFGEDEKPARAKNLDGELYNRLTDFVNKLDKFRDYACVLDVASLAGKITSSFGCFNHALKKGGEREAAALDAYLEHLSSLTDICELHDYIKYIDRVGTPYINVGGGSGAVRVMTIHKSKGLEFTHVILPNLEKQFDLRDSCDKVICDKNEGVIMHSYNMGAHTKNKNARYNDFSEKVIENTNNEEMRVLYVAMTRAQRGITLISSTNENRDKSKLRYYDWLKEQMAKDSDELAINGKEAGGKNESAADKGSSLTEKKPVKAVKPNLEFGGYYEPSNARVKATVSGVVHSTDEEEKPQDLSVRFGGDDRAAERGSAYHKFMQYADFSKEGSEEYDRLCKLFSEEAKHIGKDKFERAFGDISAYVKGAKYYREKAFVLSVPASFLGETDTDATVLVQGVIDLLVVRKDEKGEYAEVLDYKTGSGLDSKAYAGQLGWYAYAVNKLLNLEVRKTYLYGIDGLEAKKIIEVDCKFSDKLKKKAN